jgi:hypothetical protein
MALAQAPTARRDRPPLAGRIFRRLNPVLRGVLRSPLHVFMSRRLLVITYAGRRSGRTYAAPVAYLRQGADLLVAGGAPWWRNIESGASVGLRLRGRDLRARVEGLSDPETLSGALAYILPRNPFLRRFMQLAPGPDGQVSRADVERAQARGLTVLRLHPEPPA